MEQIEKLYLSEATFLLAFHPWKESLESSQSFISRCYRSIVESLIALLNERKISLIGRIKPDVIMSYLAREHLYSTAGVDISDRHKMEESAIYEQRLSSIVLDKYFTIDLLPYREERSANDFFYPPLTSLHLYTNYLLHLLKQFKQKQPSQTLMIDLLHKGFQMTNTIVGLLADHHETEAFSIWRTLHETECIVIILGRYGQPVIDAYLKHSKYGLAFRNSLGSVEETDAVFVKLKAEMREHDLKSKDMKRFIECGWLYAVPDIEKYPDFRLNFRNGTENIAGLSSYNSWYEMSSEVAHSSPLLIYSNEAFFFQLTLVNLYESFLRLESIFTQIYLATMPKTEQQYLITIRQRYQQQLEIILGVEREKLKSMNREANE